MNNGDLFSSPRNKMKQQRGEPIPSNHDGMTPSASYYPDRQIPSRPKNASAHAHPSSFVLT